MHFPHNAPSGPVVVHTDSTRTRALVPGIRERSAFIDAHVMILKQLVAGRPAWFPTFNYDFLGTRIFDPANDRCQVGAINENVRTSHAEWRTHTPVFNFAGWGEAPLDLRPSTADVISPFNDVSTFGQAASQDGIILWYGAPFSSSTILHHAEGNPLYRYDKDFRGTVVWSGQPVETVMRYHVRPWKEHLDYDWDRLIPDARADGVIKRLMGQAPLFWASARGLVNYWKQKLHENPLYLIDAESRAWVEPKLDKLGRRFELQDFEGTR